MDHQPSIVPAPKRLRVAFVTTHFSPKLAGYADVALPRAMAGLGVEVHVIAANLNPYYSLPEYHSTYEPFLGPAVTGCGTEEVFGYTLHRLPHVLVRRRIYIKNLAATLTAIRPQIVHTWTASQLATLQAAVLQPLLGFRLFTAQHICASVFPLATKANPGWGEWGRNLLGSYLWGRCVSWVTTRCYPATPDCLDIAVRFCGVQRKKCSLRSLGVDTARFRPAVGAALTAEREEMRTRLGFGPGEIVCLYTGRFSPDKNPLSLGKAVGGLRAAGLPFRGLFVGDGMQREAIARCDGCAILGFVRYEELPPYYRAADIGVWPTQESASMLDAAASGLPIVVSDRLVARERVDTNGLTYAEGNIADLERVLSQLGDAERRAKMGRAGVKKMVEQFSWDAVARRTLDDFSGALAAGGRPASAMEIP